jgi:uncharacterized protein YbjT (DUF2867 family)
MDILPPMADGAPRRILVVGAHGFLAGFIVAALRARGHHVVLGVREVAHPPREDERRCDFARMHAPADWHDALRDIDGVVNAAGILRERGAQTFAAIHVDGPLALAKACDDLGIRRFIQISALGHARDGDFVASKHRFDEQLLALALPAVVLRPSVVYATAGSYGGTSLLRALAALPLAQWLPGDGRWLIQPLAAEDLARTVVAALDGECGLFEVGGPQPITLGQYQRAWRRWLRIDGVRAVHVSEALIDAQVRVMEWTGRGPLSATMWRMLKRGNVTAPDAPQRLRAAFGFSPRALDKVLAERPSQVQDRWQAQLYFLAPTLLVAVVLVWLLSAWAGFATPAAAIERMAEGSWLASAAPVALARAGGALDLVLAVWLATRWKPRLAVAGMAASVLAYTLAFGIALPAAWLDPLGGLAKNLVVLPALAILWVLVERR